MSKLITKDGRTILSGKDYSAHKKFVWTKQGGRCAKCKRPEDWREMEFHHSAGRGLGGAKRDDLDGRNTVQHHQCHLEESKGWNGKPLRM
jgi:hypothetical protein